MARRHRILFHGAIYHVMARGNRKERIFVDDVDRRRFLKIVAAALKKFGAECYAYDLMDNHFHKVIHTPRANLPQVMQYIDGLYTQYENWRHGTTGTRVGGSLYRNRHRRHLLPPKRDRVRITESGRSTDS